MVITFKPGDGFLSVNGTHCDGNCEFKLEAGARVCVVRFPLKRGFLPISAAVEVACGKPVCDCDSVEFTEISDDVFIAEFIAEEMREYRPPQAVLQEQLSVSGMPHLVTVFRDTRLRAIMENARGSETFDLPDLTAPRLFLRTVSFGVLSIITGITAKNKKYLRLLTYDGACKSIFEAECDDLVFDKNTFTAVTKKHDMLGRAVSETYSFNDGKFEKLNTVFAYENDRIYPAELLPYLFFEAFSSGDNAKIEKYLSADLKKSAGYLKEYITPFEKIVPEYSGGDNEIAVLVRGEKYKKITRYRFEIKDNKISNFFRV